MGALNRKRVDESFTLHTPPFDSPNSHNLRYSNHIDTHISKKLRLSEPGISDTESRVSVQQKQPKDSAVSRLRKYPEPSGKVKREVHAPCSKARRFKVSLPRFFGGFRGRDREKPKDEAEEMGNIFGTSSLWRDYSKKKKSAIKTLRHVEVIDVEEEDSDVVVVDGNEVRSEERKGLGLVLDSKEESDGKSAGEGLGLGLVVDGKVLHSAATVDHEAYKKLLSSVDKSYNRKLSDIQFEIKSKEAELEKMQSLRSLRKKLKDELEQQRQQEVAVVKKPEKDLSELFVPLTEEEEAEVKRAMSNSNRRRVLVTHENSNIQITGEVLHCLRPGAWLNDEVINVYLELLKERERREPKKFLNCHFFNTFFYKKLVGGASGYDYKSVKRWTTQRRLGYKLIDCDKIFVPIHKEVHWCLAVINKKDKKFQYLDSMGGEDSRVLGVLAKYYVDEVKDKCSQDIDVSSWEQEFVKDLPEQRNGYDCGVFMVKYTDFYSRGLGLHFSQGDMPYFRHRTVKEILRLKAD